MELKLFPDAFPYERDKFLKRGVRALQILRFSRTDEAFHERDFVS